MKEFSIFLLSLITVLQLLSSSTAAGATDQQSAPEVPAAEQQANGTPEMLSSLLDLQKNLKVQMQLSSKKLNTSSSEAEKTELDTEIRQLDKQLSESKKDFERIATGVDPSLFSEKVPQVFNWKDELTNLLEPAIKEMKRFTVRARQKTDLKDKIADLEILSTAAKRATDHLHTLIQETSDKQVQQEIKKLQPEWINIEKRLRNKLELTQNELRRLEDQEISLVDSSKNSLKTFFRDRGLYLFVAVMTFFAILLACRLLYRLGVTIAVRLTKRQEEKSLRVRLLYIVFQVLSAMSAVIGLFFVLYLAEDWFLLSMAIIFFLGLSWTVRQALPRLWQQGRLMLNIGAVRENERLILHGVPWQVVSINIFCKLVNPALEVELRIPIEQLNGLVSRPWKPEEPWFPCMKGDWVVVGDAPRAKVISLSHEQVELVARGGTRIIYPTEAFLAASPANLSRNFRLRIPFGISYNLQERATSEIPAKLKIYLQQKMEEEGYREHCLNLQVEFMQANTSSLDLLVLADFDGKVADIMKRLERAIQKWCVECCTINNWEIPFPQLTIHHPTAAA